MAACNLCLKLGSGINDPSNFGYMNTDQQKKICPNCLIVLETTAVSILTQSASVSENELNGPKRAKPTVEIVVQPMDSYRFRYASEHNNSTAIFPIRGINDTSAKRSFVTIKVNGFRGRFKVLVTCVTKDSFRQHPYELVGDGCRNGFCQRESENDMTVVFSKMGIQRVVIREFGTSLKKREEQNIDPFMHGFNTTDIDQNCVCLCFQVFLGYKKGGKQGYIIPLKPVVSRPINNEIDKLVITNISKPNSSCTGNKNRILLCGKVQHDINVRFFELDKNTGNKVWEDVAKIEYIHKNVAIVFNTPSYPYKPGVHANGSVQCYMQLYRSSDESTSEPLPFYYHYPVEHLSGTKRKVPNPRVSAYFLNNREAKESVSTSTSEVVYKTIYTKEFCAAQTSGMHIKTSAPTYQFPIDSMKVNLNPEGLNIVGIEETYEDFSLDDIEPFNPSRLDKNPLYFN